jgi:hypothetical protein
VKNSTREKQNDFIISEQKKELKSVHLEVDVGRGGGTTKVHKLRPHLSSMTSLHARKLGVRKRERERKRKRKREREREREREEAEGREEEVHLGLCSSLFLELPFQSNFVLVPCFGYGRSGYLLFKIGSE